MTITEVCADSTQTCVACTQLCAYHAQMISKRITAADVSAVTGLTRHQLRGLLAELPGFDERATRARVAREYSAQDLVVLAVCCELHARYGLRRDAIASLVGELRTIMRGPRDVVAHARLLICLQPPSVKYVDPLTRVEDGIVLPLEPIFARVDSHLACNPRYDWDGQRSLDLGPVAVVHSTAKRATACEIASPASVSCRLPKVSPQ
ncbi:MerR family transcriptional regulator [Burkholderia glumae]|uniref:MerR family transcriptional regulator n=1 Tax=Burkholderia glumae TaxID=337 RepID=UPI00358E3E3A